jgi:transposase
VENGRLDALLASGLKFSAKLLVLNFYDKGNTTNTDTKKVGAPLLFERLWKESGIQNALTKFLASRRFSIDIERIVFVSVLHQLISPGSDRHTDQWMRQYNIRGNDTISLHHFYRAMRWLGEELGLSQQSYATPFSPRCTKDEIEEYLFANNQDLFSGMTMMFFDTTSLYFEGEGGDTLGENGKSKDGCPENHQIVVGVVLDNLGNPICSEYWPGNTADVTTLVPVVKRLQKRFGIAQICIVADRGMISKDTIIALEDMKWEYILGARMRTTKEVSVDVLHDTGPFHTVYEERKKSKDPSPLQVKEVLVGDHRYIVCLNTEQQRKDAFDREAIVKSLREKLKQGDKTFVRNKGYKRYLKGTGKHFEVDESKLEKEEINDGKWVLRTNTHLSPAEVALQYKQLWTVEEIFRTMKSILESRPIFHQCDECIRGHVFCSFLALKLRKLLADKLAAMKFRFEWKQIIEDVDAIEEVLVTYDEKKFIIRTEAKGVSGKVFQAVGVALPPVLREYQNPGTTKNLCP